MRKTNYEVAVAKKAVEEAQAVYRKAVKDCYELMCSIDFTGYLPKKLPEEVLKDILGRLPEDVSEEKIAYEIACYYWRARCEADSSYIAASKAVEVARQVLAEKEDALKILKNLKRAKKKAKQLLLEANENLEKTVEKASKILDSLESAEANSLRITVIIYNRLESELEGADADLLENLVELDSEWIAHCELIATLETALEVASQEADDASERVKTAKINYLLAE
jgi:hypothetical protein